MLKLLFSLSIALVYFYFLFFGGEVLQFVMQVITLGLLLFLVLFFSWSFLKNNTPIITRYALLMGAEDSVAERCYTGKVTVVWLLFFIILLTYKVAFFLDIANMGGNGFLEMLFYLGSGVLFIGEFYLRQIFLPAHRGSALGQFLVELSQIPLKDIWQFDRQQKA